MAGYLKVTCHIEYEVVWCEAGHVTDGCPCPEPGHETLTCGPRGAGPLPPGLLIMEGDREIGITGDWMMLKPRIYTLRVKLTNNKFSAPYDIEVRDFERIEKEIVFT